MKCWVIPICSVLLVFISAVCSAQEVPSIRVPQPRSLDDTAYSYFTGLLEKALQKAAKGRVVPQLKPTILMSTERRIHELRLNRTIDIFWLGGSKARARDLLVVPIPLERGLVGYRQFIIRKNSLADFDSVKTLADLSRLAACQDAHWVDAGVFRDAKLPLVTSVNYESLFKQVAAGRCDYFPRGYHEAQVEIAKRTASYPTLMVYKPLILHYPFAAYFFVHKDNKELAQWLRDGLEKMIDEGELLAYMKLHEHTRGAFPLGGTTPKRLLVIPNNYLPDFSNESDLRYWFQPSDFGTVADSK
ncbi:transporter substrate-binding domain-containing protein [Cellvibrio sp. OA-2007]|uniref:transporter substrate-binding domain-containing protein n=1 Tax=Cellvibrio sp. OA-2007 TaxID=529823 RepID=UPI000785715E|nr:transporter substrate-binding domain-containing protein [Cellvibrio sp. OA-2007]